MRKQTIEADDLALPEAVVPTHRHRSAHSTLTHRANGYNNNKINILSDSNITDFI